VDQQHRLQHQNVIARKATQDTNDEYMQLLKKHDQQLQTISQQIEELLMISSQKKVAQKATRQAQVKPKMCTVETMTSLEWPAKRNAISTGIKRTGTAKSKPSPRREIENIRLATINESLSSFTPNNYERVDSVHSPNRYFSPERETARGGRGGDHDDSSTDGFYENMLANIDGILRSSSISESEQDLTRSSCSPTPPRKSSAFRRVRPDIDRRELQEHQHSFSAETIYINRLASKYLVTGKEKKASSNKYMVSERKEYISSSSIATKNYLEKYGLQNTARPEPRRLIHSDHHRTHLPQDRILDLDRLKRQPKYK
jgi:hypothetical protein